MAEPALTTLASYLGTGVLTLSSLASDYPSLFDAFLSLLSHPSATTPNVLQAACKGLSRLAGR